ncbi:MAG: hypothetical protein DMF58_20985, partial [Acidobacteria bacterium]
MNAAGTGLFDVPWRNGRRIWPRDRRRHGRGICVRRRQTDSTDFPTLNAAQPANGTDPAFAGLGFTDAVLARIDSNGSTPSADVSIAKSDAPDPVTTWSNLTYTLSIHNSGPDTASNVTVNDPLPSSTLFVSASTTQGSCSGTSTVSCSLGTLANGGMATVTIVVTPTVEGQITNTASV